MMRQPVHPPPHPALRTAAAMLCILCGIAVTQILLAHDGPPDDMATLISAKRRLPVHNADTEWSLIAGGDVMLSRFVATKMARAGSVHTPFDFVRDLLQSADLAIINLENPVEEGPPVSITGLKFRANPPVLEGIAAAGIDVVTLANNHLSDAGDDAIAATLTHLKDAGILATGAGQDASEARTPVILERNGTRIAILAYGESRFKNQVTFAGTQPGIALADPIIMREDIAAAKLRADVVIVSLHAGAEYKAVPDTVQHTLTQAAVDAGADLVLGHHPHVIQPLENIDGTWVIYSMGNLIFDQMWSENTRRGMLLKYIFDGTALTNIEAIPTEIADFMQPHIASRSARSASLQRLNHTIQEATVLQWQPAATQPQFSLRAMPLQSPPAHTTPERTLTSDDRSTVYRLQGGRVIASSHTTLIWSSPAHWWVEDIALGDTDGDGRKELSLLTWMTGDDGRPVQRFITLIPGATWNGSVWQSPALPQHVCSMMLVDHDGDGTDVFALLEGSVAQDTTCTASQITLRTKTDPLTPLWESERGRYWNMRTEPDGNGELLIVNGTSGEQWLW